MEVNTEPPEQGISNDVDFTTILPKLQSTSRTILGSIGEQWNVPKSQEGCCVNLRQQILTIISDAGEECDDEVALKLAEDWAHKHLPGNHTRLLNIVFTNPQGHAKYMEMVPTKDGDQRSGNIKHFNITDIGSITKASSNARHIVLQIGPIFPVQLLETFTTTHEGTYDHVLVGEMGSTLNSQRKALPAAQLLSSKSRTNTTFVVDTAQGAGAYKFNLTSIKALGLSDKLIEHIQQITFRTIIGRAMPDKMPFVGHLVAKTGEGTGGANYVAAYNMWNDMHSDPVPLKAPSVTDQKLIDTIVNGYIKDAYNLTRTGRLSKWIPDFAVQTTVDMDDPASWSGNTNCKLYGNPVTIEQIKEGYSYILWSMHKLFGVPIDYFNSGNGPGEEWNAFWQNGTFDGCEKRYGDVPVAEAMKTAYAKFEQMWDDHPDAKGTPAYDVVGFQFAREQLDKPFAVYLKPEPDEFNWVESKVRLNDPDRDSDWSSRATRD